MPSRAASGLARSLATGVAHRCRSGSERAAERAGSGSGRPFRKRSPINTDRSPGGPRPRVHSHGSESQIVPRGKLPRLRAQGGGLHPARHPALGRKHGGGGRAGRRQGGAGPGFFPQHPGRDRLERLPGRGGGGGVSALGGPSERLRHDPFWRARRDQDPERVRGGHGARHPRRCLRPHRKAFRKRAQPAGGGRLRHCSARQRGPGLPSAGHSNLHPDHTPGALRPAYLCGGRGSLRRRPGELPGPSSWRTAISTSTAPCAGAPWRA